MTNDQAPMPKGPPIEIYWSLGFGHWSLMCFATSQNLTFRPPMPYFLHKHRYWFMALIIVSVIAIFWFQMRDDVPAGGGAGNKANQMDQPSQRLPVGP